MTSATSVIAFDTDVVFIPYGDIISGMVIQVLRSPRDRQTGFAKIGEVAMDAYVIDLAAGIVLATLVFYASKLIQIKMAIVS